MLLGEFLNEVRCCLENAARERLAALRGCNSLEDLRRSQGVIDGLERARVLFDDLVRDFHVDDDDDE